MEVFLLKLSSHYRINNSKAMLACGSAFLEFVGISSYCTTKSSSRLIRGLF